LRSRCGDDNDDDECISWPNNINEDEDDDDDAPSLPDAGLTDAGLIVDNERNEPPDDPPGHNPFHGWPSFDPNDSPDFRQHFLSGPGHNVLSPKSRLFLAHECQQPGRGVAKLVSNAFNYKGTEVPTPLEIYFHLLVAAFLMTLTAKQIDTFSIILSVLVKNAIHIGKYDSSDMFKVTRLPTGKKDIRNFYTSNQASIIQCLPIPVAQNTNRGSFSYSTYTDCIQHFLGWGSPFFDFFEFIGREGIRVSLRFEAILEACKEVSPNYRPIVLMFDEWRDKFEGASTKKNRKNVLANTVTFIGPDGSGSATATNLHYTYTVCIGDGGDCSDAAEEILSREFDLLVSNVTYFYSRQHGGMVPVLLAMRSSIQDRVERCSFTCSLSYSSPLARRWGWISPFDFRGLVSCVDCHSLRLSILIENPPIVPISMPDCSECGDYDFNKIPMIYWNVLPDHYPKRACTCQNCPPTPRGRPVPSGGTYPPAVSIDFEWMKAGILFTIHHRMKSLWTSVESETYLKLCGSNAKTHQTIEMFLARVQFTGVPMIDQTVLHQTLPPAMKRKVPFDWYVDATMHLLKGLGENGVESVANWAKKFRTHAPVCRLANVWLTSMYSLQLSWLRILPFGGKNTDSTGGWVSENFIDFTGVASFVYRYCLDSVLSEQAMARRQLHWVTRFLHLQSCVFARVLATEASWQLGGSSFINELDHCIKVYLTELDNFQKTYCSGRPHWLGKANPASLLNIPKNFNLFASLRNVWDGNRENFITVLKPKFLNVRGDSSSFFVTKLDQVHKQQSLTGMMETLEQLHPAIFHTMPKYHRYQRYSTYRAYPTLSEAHFGEDSTVVSAVQLSCGVENDELTVRQDGEMGFFICVKAPHGVLELTEIIVESNNPLPLCWEQALIGHRACLGDVTFLTNREFIQDNKIRAVVFLPWEIDEEEQWIFWIWSEDKKVFLDNEFKWPSVSQMDMFLDDVDGNAIFKYDRAPPEEQPMEQPQPTATYDTSDTEGLTDDDG
jgi:hypothetical protein